MALLFQVYNPETRKFNRPPGSISRRKKPSQDQRQNTTQSLPISVIVSDDENLLNLQRTSVLTPKTIGDDKGTVEALLIRALANLS